MGKGIIGGLIAGALGAAAWAAIVYFTGFEIGYVAWGIGALVGFVAAKAAGDDAGDGLGIVAALVAVLAILAGKYAVGHVTAQRYFAANPPIAITDAHLISLEARSLAESAQAAGQKIDWPPGHDAETAREKADFPTELWEQASKNWNDRPEAERTEIKTAIEADQAKYRAAAPWELFKDSFSLWDILFIGLALVSAFQLASSKD